VLQTISEEVKSFLNFCRPNLSTYTSLATEHTQLATTVEACRGPGIL